MHIQYDPRYHHLVLQANDDELEGIQYFDETPIYGLYIKNQQGRLRALRFDLNQPEFKPLLKAFSCFTNPIRKLREHFGLSQHKKGHPKFNNKKGHPKFVARPLPGCYAFE